MDPKLHESESPTAADIAKQPLASSIQSLISTNANTTKCYRQCYGFFQDGEAIPLNVLISYWMMVGFLGPVASVEEACQKGQDLLEDLIQQGMLRIVYDGDRDMIEFVKWGAERMPLCKHHGLCAPESFGEVAKLLGITDSIILTDDGMLKQRKVALKANYQPTSTFWKINRGKSRYIAHFNPTIDSVKPLHDTLFVLILRGCGELLPSTTFPLYILHALTVLEISGSTHLTTIPAETISQLRKLRYLNLSYLLIQSLPSDIFFSLNWLEWLILRGCSNLYSLSLHSKSLITLDLSYCTALQEIKCIGSNRLRVVDLSYTALTSIPYFDPSEITHLFLRDSKLTDIDFLLREGRFEVLDLSGASEASDTWPTNLDWLELYDLSRTRLEECTRLGVSYLRFPLRCLILRECTRLEELPYMRLLTDLEVLDVSGCDKLVDLPEDLNLLNNLTDLNRSGCTGLGILAEGVFDQMSSLLNLDLSETNVKFLPSLVGLTSLSKLSLRGLHLHSLDSLTSLSSLVQLDLKGLQIISPSSELRLDFLQSFEKLQILNLSETSVVQLPNLSKLRSLKQLLLADCRRLIGVPDLQTLTNLETLDLRGTVFNEVSRDDKLLRRASNNPCEIHIVYDVPESLSKNDEDLTYNDRSGFDRFESKCGELYNLISQMQKSLESSSIGVAQTLLLEKLLSDVSHIERNRERLRSSQNQEEAEELFRELMDATVHLSAADSLDDSVVSSYLTQFLHIVIKLKLLIPSEPKKSLKNSQLSMKKSKKKLWFENNKEDDIFIVKDSSSHEFKDLLSSYVSLTIWQQYCLLCFSAFPVDKKRSLVVKKRMLIYLWAGEGFLEDYSSANMSFEEAGKAVLRVLEDKGFIEPMMEKGRESGSCCMSPFVHEFVTVKAKEEDFFDFDLKSGKLTLHFTRSQRGCLLENQANSSSSWADGDYYLENKESFKNVHTLFNVNEPVVHIRPEWFSKMKHLRVLHLGRWRSNHENPIEVYDLNFLEELKRMKTMRLISLHGLSRVIKLPDSVCMLTNLIILDLRECTDLEELPADIGSLKCLTHLDLTGCIYLTEFPKGIRLLSKLEVLKGFVITTQSCDPENTKAAQLKDLLNLNKLRKLNIVVRINVFPDDQELQVLKDMDSLSKLKITWEKDFNFTDKQWFSLPEAKNESDTEEAITSRHKGMLTSSKWKKKLKCWSTSQEDREETSRNRRPSLCNIEKLELWCYPFEIAPQWLNPGELKSLKKLYICGGNLSKLPCGTNQDKWNVTNLRLKYLLKPEMTWRDLKDMFPDLTYLEKRHCPKLPFLLCDYEGVWIKERDEK